MVADPVLKSVIDPCAEGNIVIGATSAIKVMVAIKPVSSRAS